MAKEVRLTLKSGHVEAVEIPDNIKVTLKDYDVEGSADPATVKKDEQGLYQEYEL